MIFQDILVAWRHDSSFFCWNSQMHDLNLYIRILEYFIHSMIKLTADLLLEQQEHRERKQQEKKDWTSIKL